MTHYFVLIFLSVFFLQIGLWYFFRFRMEKRKLMSETIEPLFVSKERQSLIGRLGDQFDRSARGRKMENKIREMNLPLKPSELILARIISYTGVFILISNLLVLGGILSITGAIVVVELVLFIFHRYRRKQYLKAIEEQLPDVCRLLGNAVRAGQSIQQGLQTVARVSEEPLGPHFRLLVNELALGIKLDYAFRKLEERLPSRELRFFFNTILIQKETGGNLSQVMDQMADTLKQRQLVSKAIETTTSEGRFTSILLPFFGLAFLVIFGQAFGLEKILFHPIGLLITLLFIGGQVVGFLMVRKISRIEV